MDVLSIALIGPRNAADECSAKLTARGGWLSQVGEDGPGNSGIDNTNPRLREELRAAGLDDDIKVVEVQVGSDAELAEVQAIAGEFGYRLRLHWRVSQ